MRETFRLWLIAFYLRDTEKTNVSFYRKALGAVSMQQHESANNMLFC